MIIYIVFVIQMADRQRYNYVCRRCDKEFKEEKDLNQHLLREHRIHRGHIFACRKCDYTSHRNFNLRRHLDLVHNSKDSRAVKYQERRTPHHEEAPRYGEAPPKTAVDDKVSAGPSTITTKTVKPLTVRISNDQPPKPSTSTSPALSLTASPDPAFDVTTPPAQLTGKPLAFLRQTTENTLMSSSDSEEDADPNPAPQQPNPQHPAIPSNKILASAVEKKTVRYFVDGHVVRQFDTTMTYSALIPKDWNNNVDCNHALPR